MSARMSHAPHRFSWLCLAAAAAFAPVVSGCVLPLAMMIAEDVSNDDEVAYGGYYGGDGYYGDSASALQTKNATLAGALGEAINFTGDANYVDAYDDGYYTGITIWADGNVSDVGEWAAMAAISIEGSLSNEAFKPGAKLHFSSEEYTGAPYVYAFGCSGAGSNAGVLDYEATGSETDIEVSESDEPGMVHLDIVVTFPGSGQVVHGELDVAVAQ